MTSSEKPETPAPGTDATTFYAKMMERAPNAGERAYYDLLKRMIEVRHGWLTDYSGKILFHDIAYAMCSAMAVFYVEFEDFSARCGISPEMVMQSFLMELADVRKTSIIGAAIPLKSSLDN